MCNFFSSVLTKETVYWLPNVNSHEEIIEHYSIKENNTYGVDVLRVELIPPYKQESLADPNTWVFVVNQDVYPEWFDHKRDEDRTRNVLNIRLNGDLSWIRNVDKFFSDAFSHITSESIPDKKSAENIAIRIMQMLGHNDVTTIRWVNNPAALPVTKYLPDWSGFKPLLPNVASKSIALHYSNILFDKLYECAQMNNNVQNKEISEVIAPFSYPWLVTEQFWSNCYNSNESEMSVLYRQLLEKCYGMWMENLNGKKQVTLCERANAVVKDNKVVEWRWNNPTATATICA